MRIPAKVSLVWAMTVAACGDDSGSSDGATTTVPATLPATTPLTTGEPTTAASDATTTADDGTASATDSGGDSTTGAPGPTTTAVTTTGDTTSPVDPDTTASTTTTTTGEPATTGTTTTATTGGDDTGPVDLCKVGDDMNGMVECKEKAPPDSFQPQVQWSWKGIGNFKESITTPLVANMTDDNGDGVIDLCDTPDVVVIAAEPVQSDTNPGYVAVLDGATGTLHYSMAMQVIRGTTPALGDIDGDGIVEVLAVVAGGKLAAFEHDGPLKWTSATAWGSMQGSALGLADLDADGDIEIYGGTSVWDHDGVLVFAGPNDHFYSASAAADLDGDGKLELITGSAAFHHDGSVYYNRPDLEQSSFAAYPQIANLDDDPEPEVLVNAQNAIHILEHDGTTKKVVNVPQPGSHGAKLPSTIHDFDGDGLAEFAASSGKVYTLFKRDGTVVWSTPVIDASGLSAGTAFDFLGDGKAEAMYADEHTMFVFGEQGQPLLQTPRLSGTIIEYPTVADIDNDGSAEILVVSNTVLVGGMVEFTVQAIRDVDDRWIQARRIWNQHTYHVTNVREDGTIPQHEPQHWGLLNTFRTNAQIEGGGVCLPAPQ